MPTYDRECQNSDCEHEFTTVSTIKESQERVSCPQCGKATAIAIWKNPPNVMNTALPDGTRRFDNVRRAREAQKIAKAERDAEYRKLIKTRGSE